jgi:hypothetical protein
LPTFEIGRAYIEDPAALPEVAAIREILDLREADAHD